MRFGRICGGRRTLAVVASALRRLLHLVDSVLLGAGWRVVGADAARPTAGHGADAVANNGRIPAAAQFDAGEVAPGAVHRVVVPGRQQQRPLDAVQLLPQLGRQGVVQIVDPLSASTFGRRPGRLGLPGAAASTVGTSRRQTSAQKSLGLQPGLDLAELLLVVRPLDQCLQLTAQDGRRLDRVAPVAVHVHRTPGGRVVDEQDARDDVVVGRRLLQNARDRVVGDEVLDHVLAAGHVLHDLEPLDADLQRHLERLHLALLGHQAAHDRSDVLLAAQTLGLLRAQEPQVVGRLLHLLAHHAAWLLELVRHGGCSARTLDYEIIAR